jgi:hypothetical protein
LKYFYCLNFDQYLMCFVQFLLLFFWIFCPKQIYFLFFRKQTQAYEWNTKRKLYKYHHLIASDVQNYLEAPGLAYHPQEAQDPY